MAEKKLNGLLVKAVNYGERDKIITIFTLEEGLVSAKIKGVKKADAKLKFASEPFCFSEYILSSTSGRNTVTGASLYDGFYPIREKISSYYAGSVILEFIREFCMEGETYPTIFLLVTKTLEKLAYSDANPIETLIGFLLSALKEVGYGLETKTCVYCEKAIDGRVFFEPSSGGFLCLECVGETGMEISKITYAILKSIEENGFAPDLEDKDRYLKRVLKLIDFYISDRTSASVKALKDLIEL